MIEKLRISSFENFWRIWLSWTQHFAIYKTFSVKFPMTFYNFWNNKRTLNIALGSSLSVARTLLQTPPNKRNELHSRTDTNKVNLTSVERNCCDSSKISFVGVYSQMCRVLWIIFGILYATIFRVFAQQLPY